MKAEHKQTMYIKPVTTKLPREKVKVNNKGQLVHTNVNKTNTAVQKQRTPATNSTKERASSAE